MTKETKIRLVLYLLATIGAFAFGRYTASFQPSTETSKQEEVDTDKHRVTIIVRRPDGTEEITETEDSSSHRRSSEIVVVQAPEHSVVNVSLLVGSRLARLEPVYGVSVSKEFLGPVTLGAFAMTDGLVGVSIGLNF